MGPGSLALGNAWSQVDGDPSHPTTEIPVLRVLERRPEAALTSGIWSCQLSFRLRPSASPASAVNLLWGGSVQRLPRYGCRAAGRAIGSAAPGGGRAPPEPVPCRSSGLSFDLAASARPALTLCVPKRLGGGRVFSSDR